ncbi:histidine kinase dimerization/phospho-acceptor domain-containing protein [Dissulfurispira sp.]|uniref:histidine kinase dimerization/phospho-acceptor domain-containing protein n=1 Tax=Dissulfurispira sp. TaxID=2817609 RepID=UPI002FDA8BD4
MCYLEEVYKDGIQRSVTHVHPIKGRRHIYDIVYTPFMDKEGAIQFAIEDIRDITDVAEMQERIKDSEKMAAVGRLISGLAHEINNPLAIISGYVQLAADIGFSDEERFREACGKIREATERISKLMKILMDFAGVDSAPLHPVSINEALKNTFSILQKEIENRGCL